MTIVHKCRKRAAGGELPLIFDDVYRTSGEGAHEAAFAEIESSVYKRQRTAMLSLSTSTSPQTSDQAMLASRFASRD